MTWVTGKAEIKIRVTNRTDLETFIETAEL